MACGNGGRKVHVCWYVLVQTLLVLADDLMQRVYSNKWLNFGARCTAFSLFRELHLPLQAPLSYVCLRMLARKRSLSQAQTHLHTHTHTHTHSLINIKVYRTRYMSPLAVCVCVCFCVLVSKMALQSP